jgi:protein-S-isoprenylcysteine O-methyltransferase Ste14
MLSRIAVFAYGFTAYVLFLLTFVYAVGFIGGFLVPRSIDSTPTLPTWQALAINALLLTVFALQHSVMARPAFKRWLTRYVPQPAERSTYVWASCAAMLLLFWQWQPIGLVIWQVENPLGAALLYALFAVGWLVVLASTILINHFDLFGLRQVWFYLRGEPYRPVPFVMPGPYRHVRHPLYIGWLLTFWATPTMTAAHLFFALMTTAYILVAIQLEERDLIAEHQEYANYRQQVPMLVPGATRVSRWLRRRPARPAEQH